MQSCAMDALKQQVDLLSATLGTVQGDNKILKELNDKLKTEMEGQRQMVEEALRERVQWERKSTQAEEDLKGKVEQLEQIIKESSDEAPNLSKTGPK